MLRIGWFSTGRGEGSQKLLRAAVDAIRDRRLDATISFLFSNREPGQDPVTDAFFEQVRSYDIPLLTLSDSRFRRERNGEPAKVGQPLPAWRTEFDQQVASLISPHPLDVGMLAGYMLIMTPPLFERHPMLNLHPAAPGQPEGTWQDVTWKLIDQRVDHGGVRIHLVTAGLDEGPIATYCTYPLRGGSIDLLWRQAEDRAVADIRAADGEDFPLFHEMRRRGAMRELPLVVETLRALGDGRLRIEGGRIFAGEVRVVRGFDLTPEIEGSLANVTPV
ncbi:MAG: phosphoglycerate transporter [Chloroflexi bacterium]|nr:phosphoglycerate transporter [Chloroflexota bacterium]